MRRFLVVSGVVLLCGSVLFGQALFRKPVKVLGDPEFIGSATNPLAFQSIGPNWVEGRELNSPSGVALDNSVSPPILYIADTGNNRVLGYRYTTQVVAGSVADLVIGQVDRFSNQVQNPANGGRSTGLNGPTGVAVDSTGNLYVADSGNNRILRFPQPFSSTNQFPSLVIGQKSLNTSTANLNGIGASTLSVSASGLGRTGITFDAAGNLWVADTGNNRVLRFPASVLSAGANFPAADLVIGQADFVSSGVTASARTTKTGIARPNGLSFDSTGRLFITDQLFRVLTYDSPQSTNQAAARILGVDAKATVVASATQVELNAPLGVIALDTGPIVADTNNNRLMLYPPIANWTAEATQFSPSALSVSGQASFTVNKANQGNGDSTAGSFDTPVDIASAPGELYVVDSFNNRVLVFAQTPAGTSGLATRVIGQLDFPYNAGNMLDGKGFDFPSGFQSAAVLDTSVAPPRLYVADTLNHRILGFKDFTDLQNGQPADLVIGQPDANRNMINYPSNDATQPTASSLYLPTSLALDSAGNLYVADTGNSRILRFPTPFAPGQPALAVADLVIGQRDFTSKLTDATELTLNSPAGIALTTDGANAAVTDKGWLVVADSTQNRVLFFQKPFFSGMSATKVLGQLNFNTTTGNSDASRFNSPRGVSVDPQDRVIVADSANRRVQVFDKAANLVNYAAPLVSLPGFTAPLSVAIGPGGDFWVVDNGVSNNSLQHFPSVPNLPLTNLTADTTLPALVPHSGFVDKFNNLLVTDGINRVLYFVPQINMTNAASYSTRPLAAGTLAALFPTVATNSIAAGTATAPAGVFPLPTTLSDTQVTVNGTPTPLLFVSPGQDNVILPNVLAAGGTVDVQAVRPSTGQILGGAELALASAAPGLFTLDASGSGPILAVNFDDGTVNGPDHPVVRGKYVILYGTGVGAVAKPPADGAAASGQPAPDLPLVLIASKGTTTSPDGKTTIPLPPFIPATAGYSGLAPGFAGLWQINVLIPTDAQAGSTVVIKVFENSIPNLDQNSALTTTLSVK